MLFRSDNSTATFVVTAANTAQALDEAARRLYWEVIDDNQTVTWGVVDTSQAAGWQNIPTEKQE